MSRVSQIAKTGREEERRVKISGKEVEEVRFANVLWDLKDRAESSLF